MQITVQFNGSSTQEEMELGLKALREFKELKAKMSQEKEEKEASKGKGKTQKGFVDPRIPPMRTSFPGTNPFAPK